MHLLPKVFRSEGDMVDFDPEKIQLSIIKETGISEEDAIKVTELAVRRIISAGMKFLSGPHIREIVCSILSENEFEEERKLYTRIGMPLMDYEAILEESQMNNPDRIINPEIIHHWAANKISEEYSHLRILGSGESKAHLFGDIYIHNLKYFDLRPLSQIWDPRILLKHGLPPISSWTHCCKSGPAGTLQVAVNHLGKWLGITRGEFSGSQGFNFISTYLAPYAKGESEEKIYQAMQSLVYEINQLAAVLGRESPITSISCSPAILDENSKLPAIGAYGKINGVYGDYKEECQKIFDALTKVFITGDFNNKPFNFPLHQVYIKESWLKTYEDSYSKIWEEIVKMRTPILVNGCSNWLNEKIKAELSSDTYQNVGVLQSISINLPRYAFISKDESEFIEIIEDTMNFCTGILKKKYQIIEKRLESKHLPICSGILEEKPLFDINKQFLAINFVGLNEAVKSLSNYELHENNHAFDLGIKIISEMKRICIDMAERDYRNYILKESSSEKARFRFAKLDLKHFPETAIPQTSGRGVFYANSTHFRDDIDIDMLERITKQGKFHSIIQHGVLESISLNEIEDGFQGLKNLLNNICFKSDIAGIRFIS